jgi:hypothetical protein
MLGSISPFGERARRQRWGVTFTAYLLGSGAAGIVAGAALGALGAAVLGPTGLLGGPALAVLAGVILAGLVFDLRMFGLSLPTTHRQVNEGWLRTYRGWAYGLGFGLQLGLGMVTIVSTSAVYGTFGAALLAGSPETGALIGGTFGVVRAATLIGVARAHRADQLYRVDGRIRRWESPARRLALTLQAALVAVALAALT